MNSIWWLPTANFLVCGFGAALCLYTLVTNRVTTTHACRLCFISLAGLAFAIWLTLGMIFYPELKVENLTCRALMLIAMMFAISELRQADKAGDPVHIENEVEK